LNERKGSAKIETFLRGLSNKIKIKKRKIRGLECKKHRGKGNSIAKRTLYKGTHGGEPIQFLAC
jgi:hypothetical protein